MTNEVQERLMRERERGRESFRGCLMHARDI